MIATHLIERRALLVATAAIVFALPGRTATTQTQAQTWVDESRDRTLPVLMRWPDGQTPCPLVVYSHGLGGNREGGDVWGQAWQQAGIAVLHVQHPGSDDRLWRDAQGRAPSEILAAMRHGATPAQLLARVADVKFVLDEITRRQQAAPNNAANPWGRVRLNALGMAGHSFGAGTTQALAGERYPVPSELAEPRFKAFAAFSPTMRQSTAGQSPMQEKFARITSPFLSLTGTHDGDPFGDRFAGQVREQVHAGLPPGHKAMLVLDGADHMTFAGIAQTVRSNAVLPRAPQAIERESAHHALVAQLTTQWWRAHLMGDAAALGQLGQPQGLGGGDQWAMK